MKRKKIQPKLIRHTEPKPSFERKKEIRVRALRVKFLQVGSPGRNRANAKRSFRDLCEMIKDGVFIRDRTRTGKMRVKQTDGTYYHNRSSPSGRTVATLVEDWLPPTTRRGEKGRQSKPNRARR